MEGRRGWGPYAAGLRRVQTAVRSSPAAPRFFTEAGEQDRAAAVFGPSFPSDPDGPSRRRFPPRRLPRRLVPRRARRRLRGHRDEPALRAPRELRRGLRRRADAGQRARRALAHLLEPDRRHLGQVPRVRDAGGQPGRGRHHGADGARDAAPLGRPRRRAPAGPRGRVCFRPAPRRPRLGGPVRLGAPLRRRHDHAGHLRPLGHRRARGRDPRVPPVRDPDHRRHPGRAVRDSVPGDGRDRQGVRAGDAGVVRRPGHDGRGPDRRTPRRAGGGQPAATGWASSSTTAAGGSWC